MASPRITLETASRDELIGFVKKLEARRRAIEGKLKEINEQKDSVYRVLTTYDLPTSDSDDLDAHLNHMKLKVGESNKWIEELQIQMQVNKNLETQVAESKEKLTEQEQKLQQNFTQQLTDLRSTMVTLEENNTNLNETVNKLQKENEQLKIEENGANASPGLAEELNSLKEVLEISKQAREDMAKKVEESLQTIAEQEKMLENTKQRAVESSSSGKENVMFLENEIKRYKSSLEEQEALLSEQRTNDEAKQVQIESLTQEVEKSKQVIESMNELEKKLQEKENETKTLLQERDDLTTSLTTLEEKKNEEILISKEEIKRVQLEKEEAERNLHDSLLSLEKENSVLKENLSTLESKYKAEKEIFEEERTTNEVLRASIEEKDEGEKESDDSEELGTLKRTVAAFEKELEETNEKMTRAEEYWISNEKKQQEIIVSLQKSNSEDKEEMLSLQKESENIQAVLQQSKEQFESEIQKADELNASLTKKIQEMANKKEELENGELQKLKDRFEGYKEETQKKVELLKAQFKEKLLLSHQNISAQKEALETAAEETQTLRTLLQEKEEKLEEKEAPLDVSEEVKEITQERDKAVEDLQLYRQMQAARDQEWITKKEALTKAADQVNQQRDTLVKVKEQLAQQSKELEKQQTNNNNMKKQLKEREANVESMAVEVEELSEKNRSLTSTLESQEVKINKLKGFYSAVKTQKDKVTTRVTQLEQQIEEFECSQESLLQARVESLRNQITSDYEEKIRELKKTMRIKEAQAKENENELKEKIVKAESLIQSSLENTDNNERNVEDLHIQVEELEVKLQRATKASDVLDSLQSDYERTAQQLYSLQEEHRNILQSYSDLQEEVKTSKETLVSIDSTKQENYAIRNQLNDANELCEQLQSEILEHESSLSAVQEDKEKMIRTINELNQSKETLIDSMTKSQVRVQELTDQIKLYERSRNEKERTQMAEEEIHEKKKTEIPSPASPLPVDTNLLHFAQVEALHEKEKKRAQQTIEELTKALAEADSLSREHAEHMKVLEETIEDLKRSHKRENANMDYLKNIIVKYMETNDVEALLPVISTILQFNPAEIQRIKDKKSQKNSWNFWPKPSLNLAPRK